MRTYIDNVSMGEIVKTRETLMALEAQGHEVFHFESGNPGFKVSESVKTALIEALHNDRTSYIPNAGIPELKKAIIEKVSHDGIKADPNEVFVTNGAMHGLYCVFQALLDFGDEVIIPDPMWSEIADNIVLAGGIPVRIPVENYYQEIEKNISSRTKAVFINSPHNPTGKVLSPEEIKRIAEICQRHAIKLIVDEAYEHINFVSNRSCANILMKDTGISTNFLIFVYSFSKSYSMPGLRLGYTIIHDKALHEPMQKLLRCSVNGINSLSQWAGIAALRTPKEELRATCDAYKMRGMYMYECLRKYDFMDPMKPEGAFYLWVKHEHADMTVKSLVNAGIGAISGTAFGPHNKDFFRLAFSCDTNSLIAGMEKFDMGFA